MQPSSRALIKVYRSLTCWFGLRSWHVHADHSLSDLCSVSWWYEQTGDLEAGRPGQGHQQTIPRSLTGCGQCFASDTFSQSMPESHCIWVSETGLMSLVLFKIF